MNVMPHPMWAYTFTLAAADQHFSKQHGFMRIPLVRSRPLPRWTIVTVFVPIHPPSITEALRLESSQICAAQIMKHTAEYWSAFTSHGPIMLVLRFHKTPRYLHSRLARLRLFPILSCARFTSEFGCVTIVISRTQQSAQASQPRRWGMSNIYKSCDESRFRLNSGKT